MKKKTLLSIPEISNEISLFFPAFKVRCNLRNRENWIPSLVKISFSPLKFILDAVSVTLFYYELVEIEVVFFLSSIQNDQQTKQ